MDVVISGVPRAKHKVTPRPSTARVRQERQEKLSDDLKADGPPHLLVVCAVPPDVYSAASRQPHASRLTALLDSRLQSAGLRTLADRRACLSSAETPQILGVAVVKAWRFLMPPALGVDDSVDAELSSALRTFHGRSHRRAKLCGYVECPILAVASVCDNVSYDGPLVERECHRPSNILELEAVVRDMPFLEVCFDDGGAANVSFTEAASYQQLLQTWTERFGILDQHLQPTALPIWQPIAELMVKGAWRLGMSCVTQCSQPRRILPGAPPRSSSNLLFLNSTSLSIRH